MLTNQIDAITQYVENTGRCRSEIIAAYFNDHSIQPCGICDNCIEKKKTKITAGEFSVFYTSIMDLLEQRAMTLRELTDKIKGNDHQKIWNVIKHLMEEDAIEISDNRDDGKIMIKKKGQDKNPARF